MATQKNSLSLLTCLYSIPGSVSQAQSNVILYSFNSCSIQLNIEQGYSLINCFQKCRCFWTEKLNIWYYRLLLNANDWETEFQFSSCKFGKLFCYSSDEFIIINISNCLPIQYKKLDKKCKRSKQKWIVWWSIVEEAKRNNVDDIILCSHLEGNII